MWRDSEPSGPCLFGELTFSQRLLQRARQSDSVLHIDQIQHSQHHRMFGVMPPHFTDVKTEAQSRYMPQWQSKVLSHMPLAS